MQTRFRAGTVRQMLIERYMQALHAFNKRDLDGWLALVHEDVEIESRFSQVHSRYRGHAAIRRWWDDLGEAWEDLRVDAEVVHEVADNETLALVQLNAKGRGSGLEVQEPAAHRVIWRNGLWVSLDYVDRAEAERELRQIATKSSES
jgi:ketosteroid isomerase-like protein